MRLWQRDNVWKSMRKCSQRLLIFASSPLCVAAQEKSSWTRLCGRVYETMIFYYMIIFQFLDESKLKGIWNPRPGVFKQLMHDNVT